jgi:hypothetical protein
MASFMVGDAQRISFNYECYRDERIKDYDYFGADS